MSAAIFNLKAKNKTFFLVISLSQVGRSGVDIASSSDAQGLGFEPRPLHLKNTTSLPETKWLFGARCVEPILYWG